MNSYFYKKLATGMVALAALATAANAADDCVRYKNCKFDVDTTANVVYAKDVPQLTQVHNLSTLMQSFGQSLTFYKNETDVENIDLTMDIFKPNPEEDEATNRAAVIVAHGGAFVAGAKDDDSQQSIGYCGQLASRGFVVASIQYRLGVTLTDDGDEIPADAFSLALALLSSDEVKYKMTIESDNYARAVYRGVQDINAAVRYIRKHADELGVDPDRIYVLGNSAGAIMSIENVYTNAQEDFPSTINKAEAYTLGGVNAYGEEGVDAHANGAVALWGATHDPSTLGHNKTPIFLAHGTSDGTVLYGTGKPMSSYNVSRMLPSNLEAVIAEMITPYAYFLKLVLSSTYKELATATDAEVITFAATLLVERIANNISLNIDAPTLYGSYVIDSALTVDNGTKAKPTTLFVEGAGHEFYDESSDKAKAVKDGVFDFLYNLATSDKVVHALAGVTIAKDKDDKLYAKIDGSYNGTDLFSLPVKGGIDVDYVQLDRTFVPEVFSTLTLPFAVNTSNLSGVQTVLAFNGLKVADGKSYVRMKKVWDESKSDVELEAYKPYMILMGEGQTALDISNAVTLEDVASTDDVKGGWTFKGTLGYKKWAEGNPRVYGFAAEADDGISIGQFVKAGAGAWISPFRAYLEAPESAKGVKGSNGVIPTMQLPEIIDVIIDDEEESGEKTTVIGQFNTRTGEIRMNASRGVFDLKGRNVGNKANKARGAYYGKMVK